MRPQITHTGALGLCPTLAGPRGARGPARPRRLQARAACHRPLLRRPAGPGRARRPQRCDHLQNKDSGLDRATTGRRRLPRLRLRRGRPRPSRPETHRSGGVAAPRALTNPRGPRRPLSPEPRGEVCVGGGGRHYHSKLPATPTSPHPREVPILIFLLFFRQPELSFSHWEGSLAVPTLAAGGAGEQALQVSAVNRCLFAVVVPSRHPRPPSTGFSFFLPPPLSFRSAVAMGYQGGCHGLPDRGRLARYLPPSRRRSRRRRRRRSSGAGGGGSARVRDAARGSVREPPRRRSQRAVEGAAAGAPPPVGWGQSYKEDPEVRN